MKTHAYNFVHRQIHNGKHKYDKNSSKTRDWKMEYKLTVSMESNKFAIINAK